ncbi:hypothetical protein Syun_016547 [Stephania yunnanensis]|uniref:Uncharacterized protein n=1 Tax=Stephania yunnanensis TaxID=152371 RepID=A0AAP0P410_9MAGN
MATLMHQPWCHVISLHVTLCSVMFFLLFGDAFDLFSISSSPGKSSSSCS